MCKLCMKSVIEQETVNKWICVNSFTFLLLNLALQKWSKIFKNFILITRSNHNCNHETNPGESHTVAQKTKKLQVNTEYTLISMDFFCLFLKKIPNSHNKLPLQTGQEPQLKMQTWTPAPKTMSTSLPHLLLASETSMSASFQWKYCFNKAAHQKAQLGIKEPRATLRRHLHVCATSRNPSTGHVMTSTADGQRTHSHQCTRTQS